MTKMVKLMVFLLLSLTFIGYAQSELIPFPGCIVLSLVFKSLGCAAGTSETDYCKYMALALRLRLDTGETICNNMPCVGYEQTGRTCTARFPRKCDSAKVFKNGICGLGKECCSD